MKIPVKRKPKKPSGRQRLRHEQAAPSASYGSYPRRSEQELNTGRLSPSQRDAVAARAKKHLRGFWLPRFGVVILLIALVLSAINLLTLSTDVKIVPLADDAALLGDQTVYKDAASKLLSQSFTNRSKLTINASQISDKLSHQFPELAAVKVTIPLLSHRPIVYMQPARPAIIISSASGSFVISSTGKVLAPSSRVSDAVRTKLPSVSDQGGVNLSPNVQALTSANVRFIETVLAQMTAKGYNPSSVTLPRAAGELDVQVAGQPYMVKFNVQANTPREQAGTFLATIAQLQRQKSAPVKYVDVRVEGRSYYQ